MSDLLSAYYNIPLEMRQLRQWVLWRLEDMGAKKPDKVPYSYSGGLANVNDPSTWCSFEQALEKRLQYSGIGFVFSDFDPFTFIDLDDPSGDNAILERQLRIAHEFNSYSEVSQSGKGLHIIIRGKVPGTGRRRSSIEVYSRARYAVMTGVVYNNKPIEEYQNTLEQLYEQMGGAANNLVYDGNAAQVHEDKIIIEMGRNAVNGEKFEKLLRGEWQDLYPPPHGSQSEADLAFIDMLAFYTQNREQITRIFRQSPLGARAKAKRQDYIERMILKSFDKLLPHIDIDGYKIAAEKYQQQPVSSTLRTSDFDTENTGSIPVPAAIPFNFSSYRFNINHLPPGLMGEIATFIYQAAPRPVPEIALAGALALMAGICGRAYNISGTGLNQYVLAIALTGVGKEAAASGIDRLMNSIKMTVPTSSHFIGPGEIASGQALVKYINDNPCFVSILGEFGLRLQTMSDNKANNSEVALRRMLLDLFNKSGHGQVFRPSIYSKKEENVTATQAPAFSLFAESTPERFFGVLNEDMISEGLLPRFNIIEYQGKRPPLNIGHLDVRPSMALTDRFGALVAMCEQIMHAKKVINVESSPDAHSVFVAFDKYCDDRINNAGTFDVPRQLWNRAHIKALKIAALIAVGVNPWEPLINAEYANWAIAFVINDVQLLSSKFEQGQVGGSTAELKQLEQMKNAIREYVFGDIEKARKYKVEDKLFNDRIIPGAYINRRLAAMAHFRNDKMGATLSIKRCIQALIDADIIREIPASQMQDKYGTRQKAYAVSNAKSLGD